MKNTPFTLVNTRTFNSFFCIIFPAIACFLVYEHLIDANGSFNFQSMTGLLYLQFLGIILCYALPMSYFLTKTYELFASVDQGSRVNQFLGFILNIILIAPFVLIGLVVLAKVTFVMVVLLAAAIGYFYISSRKSKISF